MIAERCASRPSKTIRATLFVTPGCHCDRCFQLRHPEIWSLAQAMMAIAAAVLMAQHAPFLCHGLKRAA